MTDRLLTSAASPFFDWHIYCLPWPLTISEFHSNLNILFMLFSSFHCGRFRMCLRVHPHFVLRDIRYGFLVFNVLLSSSPTRIHNENGKTRFFSTFSERRVKSHRTQISTIETPNNKKEPVIGCKICLAQHTSRVKDVSGWSGTGALTSHTSDATRRKKRNCLMKNDGEIW